MTFDEDIYWPKWSRRESNKDSRSSRYRASCSHASIPPSAHLDHTAQSILQVPKLSNGLSMSLSNPLAILTPLSRSSTADRSSPTTSSYISWRSQPIISLSLPIRVIDTILNQVYLSTSIFVDDSIEIDMCPRSAGQLSSWPSPHQLLVTGRFLATMPIPVPHLEYPKWQLVGGWQALSINPSRRIPIVNIASWTSPVTQSSATLLSLESAIQDNCLDICINSSRHGSIDGAFVSYTWRYHSLGQGCLKVDSSGYSGIEIQSVVPSTGIVIGSSLVSCLPSFLSKHGGRGEYNWALAVGWSPKWLMDNTASPTTTTTTTVNSGHVGPPTEPSTSTHPSSTLLLSPMPFLLHHMTVVYHMSALSSSQASLSFPIPQYPSVIVAASLKGNLTFRSINELRVGMVGRWLAGSRLSDTNMSDIEPTSTSYPVTRLCYWKVRAGMVLRREDIPSLAIGATSMKPCTMIHATVSYVQVFFDRENTVSKSLTDGLTDKSTDELTEESGTEVKDASKEGSLSRDPSPISIHNGERHGMKVKVSVGGSVSVDGSWAPSIGLGAWMTVT